MLKFKQLFVAFAGLSLLLVIIAAVSPMASRGQNGQPANKPATDVRVVNTPSVTIAGTPSVDVVNMPAVQLAGTPSVSIANQTLQVRDVDRGARQPFQAYSLLPFTVLLPGSNSTTSQTQKIADVPPGKRFVIEYASFSGDLASGAKLISLYLYVDDDPVYHALDFVPRVADTYSIGHPVKLYANEDVRLYYVVSTNVGLAPGTNAIVGSCSISGYLEDVP